MKPGYRTTEFWLAVATVIVPVVLPGFPMESALAIAAYILSRGWAKSKASYTDY